MKLLSIIIPVYNAAQYLERCVESCLSQGLKQDEYEILLCNDGSTDNSFQIAKQLQDNHQCIKVFSQENAGAGMARNLGLRHAQGKYIMFVDSDDYLIPNSIKAPLGLSLNNNLDVCRYVINSIFLSNGNNCVSSVVSKHILIQGSDLLSNRKVPLDSACSALYRLSFLKTNNILFSKLSTSEDVEFTLQVYLHAERIMLDDTLVYVYEIKDDTRGHPTNPHNITQFIRNDLSIASMVKSTTSFPKLQKQTKKALKMRSNSTTVSSLWSLWKLKDKITRFEAEEIIKYATDLDIYPITGRTFSWKTSLLAHMFINRKKLFLLSFRN